jgi:hypothetical protein
MSTSIGGRRTGVSSTVRISDGIAAAANPASVAAIWTNVRDGRVITDVPSLAGGATLATGTAVASGKESVSRAAAAVEVMGAAIAFGDALAASV